MAASGRDDIIRRVDRKLGNAEDRIRRALAAGPCDYEELVERIGDERDERLRAAGVADAEPKGPGPITHRLRYCSGVIPRYTGIECAGPRKGWCRYLAFCTFELSPYEAYVKANPSVFYESPYEAYVEANPSVFYERDGPEGDAEEITVDTGYGKAIMSVYDYLAEVAHYEYAKLRHGDVPQAHTDSLRRSVYRFAALHRVVSERAAAVGAEPPPQAYFLSDLGEIGGPEAIAP